MLCAQNVTPGNANRSRVTPEAGLRRPPDFRGLVKRVNARKPG
jgi:hypothetical protein